jgi:hypothetical protein
MAPVIAPVIDVPIPRCQPPSFRVPSLSGAIHPRGLRVRSCLSISVEFGLAGIWGSKSAWGSEGAWHLGNSREWQFVNCSSITIEFGLVGIRGSTGAWHLRLWSLDTSDKSRSEIAENGEA